MKIDVLGLQAFTAVVDQGSFSKAAQTLHISQTALSHRLKALESLVGARLIDRTTRSWALTATGETFYPRAKRLVNELLESFIDIRDAAKHGERPISAACISLAATELLPRAVLEYSRTVPQRRVRILEMGSADVVDAVLESRADFGICFYGGSHPDIEIGAVKEQPYVLICRNDHPLSRKRRVSWEDLNGQAVITMGNTTNGVILNKIFTDLKFNVKVLHEAHRTTTALALVAAGLGLAIMPKLALRPNIYPAIRSIPLVAPVIRRPLAMIRRKRDSFETNVQFLYELVRGVLEDA